MNAPRTLILGATGTIGTALMQALPGALGVSRRDGLDWQTPNEAEACLRNAAADGPFSLIIDATGALQIDGHRPEKTIRAIDADAMAAQFAVNATGPALVLKHHDVLMPRTGRTVFATLSARVGSIGDNRLGGWIAYRAAKAALNQIVRTAAIEIARKRPESVVVALHPGTVATPLSNGFAGSRDAVPPERAAANLIGVINGLGPQDSGGFFAWDGSVIPF